MGLYIYLLTDWLTDWLCELNEHGDAGKKKKREYKVSTYIMQDKVSISSNLQLPFFTSLSTGFLYFCSVRSFLKWVKLTSILSHWRYYNKDRRVFHPTEIE